MLLSNSDIEKIESIGYNRFSFTRSKRGYLRLKNKDGRCVFHDGKKCMIYEKRPEGCKLYPLIFDNECKSAIIDRDCPYSDNFSFNKNDFVKLSELVNRIFKERKTRILNYKKSR